MITNTGSYWSTGMVLVHRETTDRTTGQAVPTWGAHVDFYDSGFCDDDPNTGQVSTEGTLRTRYYVHDGENASGLQVAIDTLLADAQRLGIVFHAPSLFYKGDGEDSEYPPPTGWRDTIAAEAERIGWHNPYKPASTTALTGE